MPGIAPAKVQHIAIKISRSLKREVVPHWDEEAGSWIIAIDEELECTELLHELMAHETGECYHSCDAGHLSTVSVRFRPRGRRTGPRVWKDSCDVSIDDGAVTAKINMNDVMSLLSKPTNPQGDGKAASVASGSNKQQMSVKRTTVIRV